MTKYEYYTLSTLREIAQALNGIRVELAILDGKIPKSDKEQSVTRVYDTRERDDSVGCPPIRLGNSTDPTPTID